MSEIENTLALIKDEFSIFSDPRDKYVYLVDLAKDMKGLNEDERIEENRIHGCTSQAWVIKKLSGKNYFFTTDSDAMIVKGLLSLIERSFNGHTKEEILNINGGLFLESIGLGSAISSQRTNGFSNAIHKIQNELLD
ncbi:MAG: SufE family protein [Candidatus Marinimicrobia bacterium]|jgi:cysteine desulfuration protein SufE|nr:SufE family protein [Candidatus Neomarinimicrobiota bacterium]MBT3796997.1 SufE family protein [Candidatus Neomarinimicrobiota bacterium]MBT4150203.1 SufE family protein [Candidatus Neomarinimicrobiota bacterium]MBT4784029.1 SufE family protein [Candidatus Neomarinimicrobiota bacterium]MBT5096388.1 SufE family protein [Candidatus Neomarinimicrobiota bacterium]